MQEIKYQERILPREADGGPLCLSYTLLMDEDAEPVRYGVKITEKHSGDMAAVPDVTADETRVRELMDKLVRNSVTPVSLADVMADWL